jgi:hypothetical protein
MTHTPPSSAPSTLFRSGDEKADIVALLDYAYYIVGIWPAKEPHNVILKEAWLKRARELGEEPSR